MPHIHTEPGQHDHTVSAYIILLDGKEPRLLLHRHKKLGVYMQFGGHIELDETPWQAIKHELLEESGYSIEQLFILQPKDRINKLTGAISHPLPISYNTHLVDTKIGHFHTDIVYGFVTSQAPKSDPNEGESNDIRAFTLQQLRDLPPKEIFENVKEIGLYVLEVPVNKWDRVPTKDIQTVRH